MYSVKDFYDAYQWMYGTSKKDAAEAFKNVSDEYAYELIRGYKNQCKKAFYED